MNRQELNEYRLCLAPMVGITNRHFRFLVRLITNHCRVYTEMIPAAAIVLGKRKDLLQYNHQEHPIAVQWAGNDIKILQEASKIAEDSEFDEINLNIGCPSPKATAGEFGLCLFKKPMQVASMVAAIKQQVALPVTVKTRIAVDDYDSPEYLETFVEKLQQAGCNTFILHARPGILSGFSPKKNRTIPNLNYQAVYDLKKKFSQCNIIINGGITGLSDSKLHLAKVDGVMIGRSLVANLLPLKKIASCLMNKTQPPKTPLEIAVSFLAYARQQLSNPQITASCVLKPLLSIFYGHRQAKKIRRHVSDTMQGNISLNELEKRLVNYLDSVAVTAGDFL